MEEKYILSKNEYEIFKQFSIKMAPATQKDYLSKIILLKDVADTNNLLEITKDECKEFMSFVEEEYPKL